MVTVINTVAMAIPDFELPFTPTELKPYEHLSNDSFFHS